MQKISLKRGDEKAVSKAIEYMGEIYNLLNVCMLTPETTGQKRGEK